MDDLFADGDDAHRERVRRLTPEQRGQMIKDQVAPRPYSWRTSPDGLAYLHEHEVGEAAPGSFTVAPMATKYYTGPIADDAD